MSEQAPLDAEQFAAAEATETAIAILAGPGSGKTRVLSYRARVLLKRDRKAKALMLTFTNKAAAEMKSRALRTAAVPSDRINAGTFHSFAQSMLRAHGAAAGINPDFEILDAQDQDELANTAALSIRVARSRLREKWSSSRITREPPSREVRVFGEAYEALKRKEGVVDFDDLLVYSATLLETHPEIATAYGQHYSHILVDEFQDTNAVQFAIIQALSAHAATISVFADDDQAIFQFAGADSENVHKFIKELKAKEFSLTLNYRCTDAVVRHANLLIKADAQCSGRQMRAQRTGGTVRLSKFDSIEQEAAAIADEISGMLQGGSNPEAISVLVRSSRRAEHLVRALTARGVPVSNWLDQTHETAERRLLKSCLGVVHDTLNSRHCKRLCDFYRIPDGHYNSTEAFLLAHENATGIHELMQVRQSGKAGAPLADVLASVHASVKAIDDEMAYYLDGVLGEARAFTKHDPHFSLEHLLEELSLGRTGGAPTEGGGVKIASLHRTKGLQWPCVYIIGLENDTLPDFRATTDEQLSHERRLCFVGVCRAEDELTLTYVRQLSGYPKDRSRFLREMALPA
jgi:DNA helicase II / ATP-dependent DNA helicase PcrA